MTARQLLKASDAVGQVLIAPALYVLQARTGPGGEQFWALQNLLTCYLLGVGAWQATSCLFWSLTTPRKLQSGSRQVYTWALVLLVAGALLGGAFRGIDGLNVFGILFVFVLVFLGPMMSLWYFGMTVIEAMSPRKSTTIA